MVALLFAAGPNPAQEQNPAFTESAVKAAFLYHFGTFVDWPEPPAPGDALTIAVFGDEEIFEQLDRFLPGRVIDERPVQARLIRSIDELDNDEILYIAPDENRRLDELLPVAASTLGRLIVTDTPRGIVPGAIVNFRMLESRVRFEIDRTAATRAGLSLSSRLLAEAVRVVEEN